MAKRKIDFEVSGGGTVFIVTPKTKAAQAWLKEFVICEDTIMFCGGVAVEHRYIDPLLHGITLDGLSYE